MRLAFGCPALRMAAAAILATALVLSSAAQASTPTKVALVIGNGAYRIVPELPNPPNDAADVAAALTRIGFLVRLVTNVSYDEMRRALLEFSGKARNSEMAVVFFAGHGMEVAGENWLIPVDAELKTDVDTEQEAISLRAVMLMVSSASRLGLVVLDACRNNPFLAKMKRTISTRAVSRGLNSIEPTNNVLVAYSAKDGTTALDGDGRNSPFTTALLRYLETPGLEVSFLFRNVRDDVIVATGSEQQPFTYGSLPKEAIYLIPPPAAPPSVGADQVTWSLLKETTDQAALKRFTTQYPNSALRTDAEARIAALETAQAAKPAPPKPDEITWVLLKETTDQAALKRFTTQYPNSALRTDAEARIAALAAETAKTGPEQLTWEMVKDSKEPDQLRRFVERFPNSSLRPVAEARISALSADVQKSPSTSLTDPHELARSLQFELKRLGCFTGAVNGEFDEATKAAWRNFTKLSSISMPEEPSSDALKALRSVNDRICPLVCSIGQHAEGEQCVANRPSTKHSSKNEATGHSLTPRASAVVPRGNGKCFNFQGRQFCE